MSIRYYTEDISKVPFRLLVHAISPTMPRPLPWCVAGAVRLAGNIGLRLPPTHGVGFWDTGVVVAPEQLPAAAISRWAPILEQLRDLGFQPLKCELAATVGTKMQCSTTLLDRDCTTVAILEWTRMPTANGIEENIPLELNSYNDEGPDVVTGVVRRIDVAMAEMLQLDSVELMNLENNRPLAEQYRTHRDRCQNKRVLHLREENALQTIGQRSMERFQGMMDSGFLRELRPEEVDRLRKMDLTELHAF